MKNYVVVSTYPEKGSQNIGDHLITSSLINAIKALKGDVNISWIFRAEKWDNVKDVVNRADAVVFACLSFRPYMHEKTYPYLDKIVNIQKPVGVISAGTKLNVSEKAGSIFSGFSKETIKLLKEIDKKAIFFTTRGYLTQSFCEKIGLSNACFSGDIAFFNNKFKDRAFKPGKQIKKIIISDPHRASLYLKPLNLLYLGLRQRFPDANIIIAQHGINPEIESFAHKENIKLAQIYKDKHSGLAIYDDADLHVGFRVHGHVSSLTRRIYSYLLEQDGRGCDYGLTLERKISVPNYVSTVPADTFTSPGHMNRFKSILKFIMNKNIFKRQVSSVAVEQILTLIDNDKKENFVKFVGLEKQLLHFSHSLLNTLSKLP